MPAPADADPPESNNARKKREWKEGVVARNEERKKQKTADGKKPLALTDGTTKGALTGLSLTEDQKKSYINPNTGKFNDKLPLITASVTAALGGERNGTRACSFFHIEGACNKPAGVVCEYYH